MRRSGGLRVAGALRAPPARNVRGHARGDDPLVVRVRGRFFPPSHLRLPTAER